MPLSEKDSGSQTATISTEHTLATETDDECYMLRVDASNLVAGDVLELRQKAFTHSGDSTHVEEWLGIFNGANLLDPEVVSIPCPSVHSCRFTLKQTAGTGRAFPWSVLGFSKTVTEEASGTQTATLTTEHTLTTETGDSSYVLRVDASNLAAGERLELKIKTRARSADTTRIEWHQIFRGEAIISPSLLSIPVASIHETIFTLTQTGGTGRSFKWSVLSL